MWRLLSKPLTCYVFHTTWSLQQTLFDAAAESVPRLKSAKRVN